MSQPSEPKRRRGNSNDLAEAETQVIGSQDNPRPGTSSESGLYNLQMLIQSMDSDNNVENGSEVEVQDGFGNMYDDNQEHDQDYDEDVDEDIETTEQSLFTGNADSDSPRLPFMNIYKMKTNKFSATSSFKDQSKALVRKMLDKYHQQNPKQPEYIQLPVDENLSQSDIDFDVFYQTMEGRPDAFLRACGQTEVSRKIINGLIFFYFQDALIGAASSHAYRILSGGAEHEFSEHLAHSLLDVKGAMSHNLRYLLGSVRRVDKFTKKKIPISEISWEHVCTMFRSVLKKDTELTSKFPQFKTNDIMVQVGIESFKIFFRFTFPDFFRLIEILYNLPKPTFVQMRLSPFYRRVRQVEDSISKKLTAKLRRIFCDYLITETVQSTNILQKFDICSTLVDEYTHSTDVSLFYGKKRVASLPPNVDILTLIQHMLLERPREPQKHASPRPTKVKLSVLKKKEDVYKREINSLNKFKIKYVAQDDQEYQELVFNFLEGELFHKSKIYWRIGKRWYFIDGDSIMEIHKAYANVLKNHFLSYDEEGGLYKPWPKTKPNVISSVNKTRKTKPKKKASTANSQISPIFRLHSQNTPGVSQLHTQAAASSISTTPSQISCNTQASSMTSPPIPKGANQGRKIVVEDTYSKLYAGENNYYVADKMLSYTIELADIIGTPNESTTYLYHVKEGFEQKTRDACSQVQNSAQLLMEWRKSHNTIWEDGSNFTKMAERLGVPVNDCPGILGITGDRTVVWVYGVLANLNSVTVPQQRRITDYFRSQARKQMRCLADERNIKFRIEPGELVSFLEDHMDKFETLRTNLIIDTESDTTDLVYNLLEIMIDEGFVTGTLETTCKLICVGMKNTMGFDCLVNRLVANTKKKETCNIIKEMFIGYISQFDSLIAKMEIIRCSKYLLNELNLEKDQFKICEILPE